MKRRELLAGTAAMAVGSALYPRVAEAAKEAETIQQLIRDAYDICYRRMNKQKYRALLTDNYLLLENGEILDADGDIALMPTPEDEYKRTDEFDFKSVKVYGDTAYAVYFLKSEISDKKNGQRSRKWLESVVARRSGSNWQIAVLHSTRVESKA